MKHLTWLGSSLDDVKAFPEGARKEAGYQLHRVQQGLDPSDWKPMKAIGGGVREIRLHGESEHRVIYVAKFEESVYVLHGFTKKTQTTAKRDIELAKARLKDLTAEKRKKS